MNVGVLQVLDKLENEEIIGLANTVTQGLLKNKIESRKDAVEAILKHSPSKVSILRRKCITKEVLFEYAHQNNIPISLPITKAELIDLICAFWESGANKDDSNDQHNSVTTISPQDNNINKMAEQFSAWFYEMLNKSQPMGSEHFWSDAKLTVNILSDADSQCQEVDGDTTEIVNLLFRLRQEYNLMFNPNLFKDGVAGRLDPHGLVLVLACGTLHMSSDCVGVFEQVFVLVRDPCAENNWKIKKTDLNLWRKSVTATPRLSDGTLTRGLLELPLS